MRESICLSLINLFVFNCLSEGQDSIADFNPAVYMICDRFLLWISLVLLVRLLASPSLCSGYRSELTPKSELTQTIAGQKPTSRLSQPYRTDRAVRLALLISGWPSVGGWDDLRRQADFCFHFITLSIKISPLKGIADLIEILTLDLA